MGLSATDELLPCPFCGGAASVCQGGINGRLMTYGLVEHKNGCFFLADGLPTNYQHVMQKDFAVWNRRAERGRNGLPRLDETVDYLCDMCANGCDERRVIRVGQSAYDVCERWLESDAE